MYDFQGQLPLQACVQRVLVPVYVYETAVGTK